MSQWTTSRTPLAGVVEAQTATLFGVYEIDEGRLREDFANEAKISTGGYSTRQLEELVQNAVDATRDGGHRVEVVLTKSALYVANDGAPFDERGVKAVMASNLSEKGEEQIGRFGIGFKSVLAVSDSPCVYSTSVSFGFDKTLAAERFRSAGHDFSDAATMRIALLLDAPAAFETDAVLSDLATWASTIITLPLKNDEVHRLLSSRLDLFRDEFMLFSPHVTRAAFRNEEQVVFTDEDCRGLGLSRDEEKQLVRHPPAATRELSITNPREGVCRLHSNDDAVDWAVQRSTHHPSTAARKEGAYAADRSVVEVTYAVCLADDRYDMGQFWAFFPTADVTTLSGIVNAPWKLSDDRKHILRGAFNEELLTQVLPDLVTRAFRSFEGSERTAAVLDAMPARGGESRSDADDVINGPVFQHLRHQPVLPDGTGTLRVPRELRWLGGDVLGTNTPAPQEWLEGWAEAGGDVGGWVHPSGYTTRERRSKINRLMTSDERFGAAVRTEVHLWLEDLVADRSVARSVRAISFAAWLIGDADGHPGSQAFVDEVHEAKIIKTDDGTFAAPTRGRLFVRVDAESPPGVRFVDPEVVESAGTVEALSTLGVVLMDQTGQLQALLTRARESSTSEDVSALWDSIWSTLRSTPHETAFAVIRDILKCRDIKDLAQRMRVRTSTGHWVALNAAYLAGDIVPTDGSRDAEHLIDPQYHRGDREMLEKIGAVSAPAPFPVEMPRELWFAMYVEEMRSSFIGRQSGAKPDRDYIDVTGGRRWWPMQPLVRMSPAARKAATARIMAQGSSSRWTVRHVRNRSYGTDTVLAPEIWFARQYGLLSTSFGPRRPQDVLRASESIDPAVLPAVHVSRQIAEDLGMRSEPASLVADEWDCLKAVADTWTRDDADDRRRAAFYVHASRFINPTTIVCLVGDQKRHEQLGNVGVTDDEDSYALMRAARVPALLVAEGEVSPLVERWSLRRGKDLLNEDVSSEPSGEAEFLVDLMPSFKLWLGPGQRDLKLQMCSRLDRLIATPQGQRSIPVAGHLDGDTVMITARDDRTRVQQISDVLGLAMSPADVDTALAQGASTRANELRSKIAAAEDDDERLVMAVGVDALRSIIPIQALEHFDSTGPGSTPREVAALACAVHGIGVLQSLRADLDHAGLEPPKEWTGRYKTRQWVSTLGFPAEWAGFATHVRPQTEVVDAPSVLGELHGFQKHVMSNIAQMLSGPGGDRGLVSLPTGAGKTRVTVEALVNGLNTGTVDRSRPLVWIAQTDELCEQAAETWKHVWRTIGQKVPLNLGRLWDRNEVPEEPGGFQLVVATINKLDAIRKRDGTEYDWLREPSVVVVDEAHASLAPMYTQVLDWLGRDARSRNATDRRPLIGLTATPFRGRSVDETKRLANRYDHHRLDSGAFSDDDDPYSELQAMGVLAQVQHRLLHGTELSLTPADVAEMVRYRQVPPAVMDRLGADLARSQRIVESIAALPEDWSVLVFATSVDNARVLAALLAQRGVSAVSVSSKTDTAARRHYVDEFKAGRIRVLTNYQVFMQGFDAPKVQAVYVAQPTFSPNVYQQMVGRGLRGPSNGGSESVLIVNVLDNFLNYGGELAFREFEYLWEEH